MIHSDFPKPLPLSYITTINDIPEIPSEDECKQIRENMIRQYNDVFDSTVLKPMEGKPVKIYLTDDAIPNAISCPRKIPYAWREQVKNELEDMVKKEIIRPIDDTPTDFVSPLVVVQKPNGKIRICVDYTKLNRYVKRPTHPFKSPSEAVSNINVKSKYFSTLDATSGYWQLKLDEESQKLTTFLTPWGRYLFLRTPMGLVSSGDEYCRRGDEALLDIGNIEKVVDDILVYDETFKQHYKRITNLLDRCRKKSITLNQNKFIFAKSEVSYVGYVIGKDGIKADPKKIEGIQKFPTPKNITELRSFMGLVNQLGSFSTNISSAAGPLRSLLKTKNMFIWTSVHDNAFKDVRHALTMPPVLAHFDAHKMTAIHTDASRKNGLGYALLQKHEDGWKLIQCGSRFLSETESRYAMIEIELLAIAWSVLKCRLYLLGLPSFAIVTDHKPLLSILNNSTLDSIENPRIQRLKEKLLGYSYVAEWKKGKEHLIPDALSRSPVLSPVKEDMLAEEATSQINSMLIRQISIMDNTEETVRDSHLQDPMIEDLKQLANEDKSYQMLTEQIKTGFPKSKKSLKQEIFPYWNVRDELSNENGLILKGCQIVIPQAARRLVLQRLHDAHQGIERTSRRARQTVYWPAMISDIKNTVEACDLCQTARPSQQKETIMTDPLPSRPFLDVSADLFSCCGKHFMVYADRLSGWPIICHYGGKDPNSQQIICDLKKIFADTGVPVRFRSDNGPQFASREFKTFLKKWNVVSSPSTPYFPQSNGHAEANVKAMKTLIVKCVEEGQINTDKYYAGLLEWRNTPRVNGRSPAQILYGHPLRSLVPAHYKSFSNKWQMAADLCDQKATERQKVLIKNYNRGTKDLALIPVGTKVRIQNPVSKLWNNIGLVVELGPYRNYTVKTASGRVYVRNRRFLRPINCQREGEEEGLEDK